MTHKQKSNSVMLSDGSILEREALGVFKIKNGSETERLRIAAGGITLYEMEKNWPYTTRDEKFARFVEGIRGIVFDLETLKVKMLKMPRMDYTAFLDRKEILVEDYIEADGTKYFSSFIFKPDDARKSLKDLLKLPIVREDWEKIKAMKRIE